MRKRFEKRGLSSIITSLILLLLVLVAIGITWIFLRNIISEESEDISFSKITINLKVEEVNIRDDGTEVFVKRGIGKGDLVGIKFAIRNGTETTLYTKDTDMEELEVRKFILDYTGNIDEVTILPLLRLESGKIVEGNIADITSENIQYIGGSVGEGEECVPDCTGKECGDDGCEGTCLPGCAEDFHCENGICVEGPCSPICNNSEECCFEKECGTVNDGCGTTYYCGDCEIGEFCVTTENICMSDCVPNCTGKECGDNGCGEFCGFCTEEGYYCNITSGLCVEGECEGNCTEKECGDDGCGEPCGFCNDTYNENYVCISGNCYCNPDCIGKECGEDGCGDVCGECNITAGEYCENGTCVVCVPNCTLSDGNPKECGDDGCGDVCGECGLAEECIEGICVAEVYLNSGLVYSIWPPESRLLFDSEDLPKSGESYIGYHVRFQGSSEDRCILITNFVTPSNPDIYNRSYIEFGVSYTNMSVSEVYEIWETFDGCTRAKLVEEGELPS